MTVCDNGKSGQSYFPLHLLASGMVAPIFRGRCAVHQRDQKTPSRNRGREAARNRRTTQRISEKPTRASRRPVPLGRLARAINTPRLHDGAPRNKSRKGRGSAARFRAGRTKVPQLIFHIRLRTAKSGQMRYPSSPYFNSQCTGMVRA